MQIRETINNIKNFVESVVNSRAFLKLASATVIIASLVPNAALAIAAVAAKIFNKPDLASSLEYTRRKFVIIVQEHFKANFADAPLPLLTRTKNLPTREVIYNEQDKPAIAKMRTAFLNTFPDLDTKNKIANMKNKGASFTLADTMCLGGCFSAIKKCLNAKSEEELIGLAKQFDGGFDAEAAAAQKLYRKLYDPNVDKKEELYTSFGQLMGLKIVPESHQNDVRDFDSLAKGAHLLTIDKTYEYHNVVLFKFDFGTYLFDPEYGLMTTQAMSTAGAVNTLIKSYQKLDMTCESYQFRL
ncbi:MAG: hypothetical protein JSR37_07350 [Verrucomicrobia bacterium]|nr:hypothetical protein [Verrucomicrobiota bacterium]MBS0637425.1 hypothetical protein [Verrucomicrobiota bacterium]